MYYTVEGFGNAAAYALAWGIVKFELGKLLFQFFERFEQLVKLVVAYFRDTVLVISSIVIFNFFYEPFYVFFASSLVMMRSDWLAKLEIVSQDYK